MKNGSLRFKALIAGREIGAVAAIIAPFDVMKTFATRARVPVRGTINGFPFRSSLMPMKGCHIMPVNKTLREGASVQTGEIVEVVMERDESVRDIDAPPDLKKALTKSKTALRHWDKLPYTHKKEIAVWITGAKKPETRERRVQKTFQILQAGNKWTG